MKNSIFLFLILSIVSCSDSDSSEVQSEQPDFSISDRLTVHPAVEKADTLQLIRYTKFGDTEDVFYSSLSEFAVDDSGRVYVADSGWGSRSLHIYNPDGSYVMKLAGEGKGPGEFLSLSNLQFNSGNIMFYDSELKRIKLFSVDPPELSKTILVENLSVGEGVNRLLKDPTEINLESDGNFLVGFEETPRVENAGNRLKSYFRLDSDFNVISENLINIKAREFTHSNQEQNTGNVQFRIMKDFPFFARNFFVSSQEGEFYTVETRHFMIREYDKDGDYVSGFYHPFNSPKVTRQDAFNSINELAEDLAKNVDLPAFWPVVNSITVDDENRFWVSANTENEDYFEWWVLEESGELKAKFRLPGNRYQQPGGRDNIVVKNGYFYKREVDPVAQTSSIIKYKIQFKEN